MQELFLSLNSLGNIAWFRTTVEWVWKACGMKLIDLSTFQRRYADARKFGIEEISITGREIGDPSELTRFTVFGLNQALSLPGAPGSCLEQTDNARLKASTMSMKQVRPGAPWIIVPAIRRFLQQPRDGSFLKALIICCYNGGASDAARARAVPLGYDQFKAIGAGRLVIPPSTVRVGPMKALVLNENGSLHPLVKARMNRNKSALCYESFSYQKNHVGRSMVLPLIVKWIGTIRIGITRRGKTDSGRNWLMSTGMNPLSIYIRLSLPPVLRRAGKQLRWGRLSLLMLPVISAGGGSNRRAC